MSRGNISKEERIKAVEKYKSGKGSYESIAKEYGICKCILVDLVAIYDSQGIEALYDTDAIPLRLLGVKIPPCCAAGRNEKHLNIFCYFGCLLDSGNIKALSFHTVLILF